MIVHMIVQLTALSGAVCAERSAAGQQDQQHPESIANSSSRLQRSRAGFEILERE